MVKMNKRGFELSLSALAKVVFVAMVIMVFFSFTGVIWAAVTGSAGNENTRESFDSLAENIELMVGRQSSFEAQTMILFMEKNHYILGLMGPETLTAYDKNPDEYPKKCNGQPCLCLYKDIKNFPKSPLDCKRFGSETVFHGYVPGASIVLEIHRPWLVGRRLDRLVVPEQEPHLYADYPEELRMEYEHLIIGPQESDKLKNIYVEKFVKDDQTHVLVSLKLTPEEIDKRASILGVCPGGSDERCVGLTRNSFVGSNEFCYFDIASQICVVKKNVGDCGFNNRITQPCMCGSSYVDSVGMYCFKRLTDNQVFVLPFDCSTVAGCAGYCEAITATDDCDADELSYCEVNPCGYGYSFAANKCEAYQDIGKNKCRPVAS